MKRQLALALSAIGMVSATANADKKPARQEKPNIIFFLMDDMGYGEIGVQGQVKIETPNIDALAASGKILRQHYSGSPVSAPSRCVFMTGLHTGHAPIRGNDEDSQRGDVWSHKAMYENPALEGQKPMPEATPTLAALLQKAGYTTGCVGKWGLGAPGSVSDPNKLGFDFFYGYNCQRQAHTYYPTHLYRNNKREYLNNAVLQPGTKLAEGADPLDPRSYDQFQQKEYAPDKMFAATLEFIEQNKSKPFFLWWTTPLPHVSLQAPQDLIDYYVTKFGDEKPFAGDIYFPCRYPHATYAAMCTYIDRQIGQIIAKLKADGIYDNTLIIFTSDNGATFNGGTDSPWFDSNRPFKSERGWGKCSVHEGGIRVPAIVSWKGKIAPATQSSHICAFQDWMPTLAEFAGATVAGGRTDGISLVPELTSKGKQKKHKALYIEYPEAGGSIAVREGKWKLIVDNIRKSPNYMLFDLEADPREQQNLIEQNRKVAQRLLNFAATQHTAPENEAFAMGLPLPVEPK